MELTVLLGILLAALVANTVVMVVMLQRARRSRGQATAAARTAAPSSATRPAGFAAIPSGSFGPGGTIGAGSGLGAGALGAAATLGASRRMPAVTDARALLDPAAFHELLAREDGRLQRYHRPATVVVFELDGLAALTERLGADAGERIVAAMADTIRRLARDADHVAALATGRFGVLLPETDEVRAINYVERVRRASELWLESGAISVRLAIGWSGTTGDPSLLDAYQVALDRMYAEARRNARSAPAASGSGSGSGVGSGSAGASVSVLNGPDVEPAIAS